MTLVMRPDGDGAAGGRGGEERVDGAGSGEGARDSDSDEEEEHFDISLAASHSVSTLLIVSPFLLTVGKQ